MSCEFCKCAREWVVCDMWQILTIPEMRIEMILIAEIFGGWQAILMRF